MTAMVPMRWPVAGGLGHGDVQRHGWEVRHGMRSRDVAGNGRWRRKRRLLRAVALLGHQWRSESSRGSEGDRERMRERWRGGRSGSVFPKRRTDVASMRERGQPRGDFLQRAVGHEACSDVSN
jgi:hypothetical protein